jgi:GNAT superfamily N-acetyltransferase
MNYDNAFRSARLVYRAVEDNDEDKKFFHEQLISDPTIIAMTLSGNRRPQSAQDAAVHHQSCAKCLLAVMICLPALDVVEPLGFAVGMRQSKPKPTPIGSAVLFGADQAHEHHRNRDVGISLIAGYRDNGYGSEALNWTLDWAFIHGNLHRVSLQAFSYNERALRVYEKLGFVQEGRKREALWFNRGWHDVIMFSMLESEWEAIRKAEKDATAQ